MSDDTADGGFTESRMAAKRALSAVHATCWHALGGVERWVQRRARVTHLVLGGVVAKLVHEVWLVVEQVAPAVVAWIPVPTEPSLLVVLIGVCVAQTILQLRKLSGINVSESGMTDARTDGGGGRRAAESNRRTTERGTCGGGAIGGAIAGAGLGSPYGPGGVVGGAIVGAVVGDAMEEFALQ